MRASGGKAPGATGARGVLQASQARGDETLPPQADRVPITAQFGRDVLVVGPVVAGGAEDEAATKDQGLRGRAGADEGLELLLEFGGQ